MRALDIVVGDLHDGHKAGLFYPNRSLNWRANKHQKFVWRSWKDLLPTIERIAKTEKVDTIHGTLGGDAGDSDWKNRSHYYWTQNTEDIKQNLNTALEPFFAICDNVHVLAGTRSHAGPDHDFDEHIARNFDNVIWADKKENRASHLRVDYKLASVLVNAQHYGKNKSKWGEENMLNSLRDEMILTRVKAGEDIPQIMYRFHFHWEGMTNIHKSPIAIQVAPFSLPGYYEAEIDAIGRTPMIGAHYSIYDDGEIIKSEPIRYFPRKDKTWTKR